VGNGDMGNGDMGNGDVGGQHTVSWSKCKRIPDGQTDGQTGEHHGNSATIRSSKRIAL